MEDGLSKNKKEEKNLLKKKNIIIMPMIFLKMFKQLSRLIFFYESSFVLSCTSLINGLIIIVLKKCY